MHIQDERDDILAASEAICVEDDVEFHLDFGGRKVGHVGS